MEGKACILCHERIHIKRRDYLIKPAVFAIFSFMWFQPLIWVAYHLMMKDMEISCDELALRKLGEQEKKRYSTLLLQMAVGNQENFCTNPAFSAGVLKERIRQVARYRKPSKALTMFVVVTVFLCGCGVASEPKQTMGKLPLEKETVPYEETFVRESKAWGNLDWEKYDTGSSWTGDMQYDTDGNLVTFLKVVQEEGEEHVSWDKFMLIDNQWVLQETKWMEEYHRMFKGKIIDEKYLWWQYGGDGNLYLSVQELNTTMEKHYEDPDAVGQADIKVIDSYFLRVDEKAGTVTEVPVPEDASGIEVFPDGNLWVTDMRTENDELHTDTCGLYSGVTGECLVEYPPESSISYRPVLGDGFMVQQEYSQEDHTIYVNVYDNDGELAYKLPTGVEVVENEFRLMQFGVSENTIFMLTEKGIFEADYGEKQFRQVVTPDDDMYCLSRLYNATIYDFCKSKDGEYKIVMITQSADIMYGNFICSYKPK